MEANKKSVFERDKRTRDSCESDINLHARLHSFSHDTSQHSTMNLRVHKYPHSKWNIIVWRAAARLQRPSEHDTANHCWLQHVTTKKGLPVLFIHSPSWESETNRFRQKLLTWTTPHCSVPKTVSCKFQLISHIASEEYQTKVSDNIRVCKIFSLIFPHPFSPHESQLTLSKRESRVSCEAKQKQETGSALNGN